MKKPERKLKMVVETVPKSKLTPDQLLLAQSVKKTRVVFGTGKITLKY